MKPIRLQRKETLDGVFISIHAENYIPYAIYIVDDGFDAALIRFRLLFGCQGFHLLRREATDYDFHAGRGIVGFSAHRRRC
jgi:hypothetical protein